jgi:hypothetical protein
VRVGIRRLIESFQMVLVSLRQILDARLAICPRAGETFAAGPL